MDRLANGSDYKTKCFHKCLLKVDAYFNPSGLVLSPMKVLWSS
jgi:hypothetical protein